MGINYAGDCAWASGCGYQGDRGGRNAADRSPTSSDDGPPWLNEDVQGPRLRVHGMPDVQLSAVETPL